MLTRANLLAFVAEQYATLLDTAAIPGADTTPGLAQPLNQTLRRVGAPVDGPVADAYADAAEALIEYYTLVRIRAALAASTEVEAQNARASKSQLFNQVTTLLTDAAARCAALGYAPTPTTTGGSAAPANALRIGLDFIEPWPL